MTKAEHIKLIEIHSELDAAQDELIDISQIEKNIFLQQRILKLADKLGEIGGKVLTVREKLK